MSASSLKEDLTIGSLVVSVRPSNALKASGVGPGVLSDLRLPRGEGIAGHVIATRRPLCVADVASDPSYGFPDLARKEGITSMMSVPMTIEDRVIGVINTYLTDKHEFSTDEIKMLQAVAKLPGQVRIVSLRPVPADQADNTRHLPKTADWLR